MRTVNVRPNMLKRAPELGQPKWLSDDGRMERDRADERLLRRLTQHFVELIDDQAGKISGRMMAGEHGWRVIDLNRIGHRQ